MNTSPLRVCEHPKLALLAFETEFPAPLGETEPNEAITSFFALEAEAPLERDEDCRKAVRDLLRFGGYKPTGRGKPASEYLVRAAGEGKLGSINLAVDSCNAVSLHCGLPISVVDLDLLAGDPRVEIAEKGASYVFNASGQEIDIGGLLCLGDDDGPCANAVKDAQRTKTSEATTRTLSILWAPVGYEERAARAETWYRELLENAGAQTGRVEPSA
ncbi:MAG: phenylalanine--tRNA ligase beta subunit-related protein [Planctomycetota bacterium]